MSHNHITSRKQPAQMTLQEIERELENYSWEYVVLADMAQDDDWYNEGRALLEQREKALNDQLHTMREMAAILESAGYKKLLAAVEHDKGRDQAHRYDDKLTWAIERAKHYAQKTGIPACDILNAWEERRSYWYMNWYQESNQPEIKGDKVRVFDTKEALRDAIGESGFRCPACGGISTDPYTCNTGIEVEPAKKKKPAKICDWKSWGLFGTMGKGAYVFVKSELRGQEIFMPIAWEKITAADPQPTPHQ